MSRRGVTLIELLIALAITMIMMGAVVTLFANMTTSVTDSRSVIEISERLRAARNLLQNDLMGHTAQATPPIDPASDQGFIELIEGLKYTDGGIALAGTTRTMYGQTNMTQNTILGDPDDILHLTVHSNDKPFVGQVNGVMMESQNAEIIWFALPNGRILTNKDGTTTQLWTLYRRVLLVLPGYNLQGMGSIPAIYITAPYYDISAHHDPITGQLVANSLGDLTKRENRFYHGVPGNNPPSNFPYQLNPLNLQNAILTGSRLGQDVVLDNVLAFDMKVYDPLAAFLPAADGTLVGPDQPGYSPTPITTVAQMASKGGMLGGFVNMGYGQYNRIPFTSFNLGSYYFSGAVGDQFSHLNSQNYNTYDTWSLSYEHDGYDQDGSGVADQGMNGFDDKGTTFLGAPLGYNGIVDDPPAAVVVNYSVGTINTAPNEFETLAPFPYPLQGIEVTLRVYESDSRQVRQLTLAQDFLPE